MPHKHHWHSEPYGVGNLMRCCWCGTSSEVEEVSPPSQDCYKKQVEDEPMTQTKERHDTKTD